MPFLICCFYGNLQRIRNFCRDQCRHRPLQNCGKFVLLCCITRGNEIHIPRGGDQIQVGDNVIVVTLEHGLHDLRDIVED